MGDKSRSLKPIHWSDDIYVPSGEVNVAAILDEGARRRIIVDAARVSGASLPELLKLSRDLRHDTDLLPTEWAKLAADPATKDLVESYDPRQAREDLHNFGLQASNRARLENDSQFRGAVFVYGMMAIFGAATEEQRQELTKWMSPPVMVDASGQTYLGW